MSLCINSNCTKPDNSDTDMNCQSCGSLLLLQSRYRVTKKLGEGGFGQAYQVENARTGEKWALKALIDNQDLDMEKMFKKEAAVLQKLGGKGIPKLAPDGSFEFTPSGAKQPIYCIVMEQIHGKELEEYFCKDLNKKPIDLKLAIVWLREIVEILDRVHQEDFFHRDIKPSNIMITADGRLILIDFGTIRELNHTYKMKAQGNQVTAYLSVGYTPQEQYHGHAEPRSDFFALGATFIYLLTGEQPQNLYDNNQAKYVWRDRVPDLLPNFGNLIDKMVEHRPSNRPENTSEILTRLKEIDRELNISTNPTLQQQIFKSQKKPMSPLFLAIGSGIILLSSLLLFQIITPKISENQQVPDESPPVSVEKAPDSLPLILLLLGGGLSILIGWFLFSRFISKKPITASFYYYRGLAHSNSYESVKAIDEYTKAIELDPEYTLAYYHRGLAYNGLSDSVKEISDFTKTIELDPEYTLAYYHRGLAYNRLSERAKAINDFTRAIELDPKCADAYQNRAFTKYLSDEYEGAIIDYVKAIALDDQDEHSYTYLAKIFTKLRQPENAIEVLNQAAKCYQKSGKHDKRYKVLKEIENLEEQKN